MPTKNLKVSVISYFFVSFVLDGLQRLSGLFVLELLQSMSLTRQNATVPFTFSWAVANIIASFSDCLRENKKSEHVIVFGILLTATGTALCILATDVFSLIVFWGFVFGSGYGIASPHISRRLLNANSGKSSFFLQVTPSLGVTVMPFVLHILTSYYGLQGSYLIISGIILNYLPLSVAAAYNIELRLPTFNWRVRKKSSQYVVSKPEGGNIVSVESFVNSLEPDLILKINSNNDEYKEESYSDIENSILSMKEVFPVGRKRSETRGNDLRGLEMDPRLNAIHSAMTEEILKYENRRKLYEGSFSNKNVVRCDRENTESKTNDSVNCDTSNTDKILEILNTVEKDDLKLENEIQNKEPEFDINATDIVRTELEEKCLEHGHDGIQSETKISQTINETIDSITFRNDTESGKDTKHEITSQTDNGENRENPFLSNMKEKFETEESPIKENIKHTPNLASGKLKVPLDIKVHVEEYTFVCEGESLYENFNIKPTTKDSNRNYSNSIVSEMFANIDLTSQKFSKNLIKCSDFCKRRLPSIYSISGNTEFYDKQNSANPSYKDAQPSKCMENTLKIQRLFKFLNEITSPRCLCIILITIIFEMNLVTLITVFADFGNDIDDNHSDFKWILVAFGAGGIAGKFCCCKISRTIPEKSHAIGVILFLLNGLSTAGVLFSTNLNWLAGFYGMLGALEGGITYIIPKFILEHIDRSIHTTLYSVKSFLSGLAIISIPYVIGLCRDELGDYDFLLQTLSCSSILCAVLVYFLPCLSPASDRRLTSSFHSKMEMA